MKVGVFGAGAVGGFFGAMLAKAGFDVAFICRGEHLRAMKKHGLQVRGIYGDFVAKGVFSDDAKSVGECDLVLFCVKSHATEKAIVQAKPLVGRQTVFLSLQNGLDNGQKIEKVLGKGKCLPAFTWIGARIPEPGCIECFSSAKPVFGEPDGKESERVRFVKGVFEKAGIAFEVSKDIRKDKWLKFCWNTGFNQVTALSGATLDGVFENPAAIGLVRDLMLETVAVAAKSGVKIRESELDRFFVFKPHFKGAGTSMFEDAKAGKGLEFEAFSGFVVKKAELLGVKVPKNEAVYALLSLLDSGR
ncbi:MAG: 2-dehydropantoate 2-reductase [Candidatus Diapherotrites archaeon]|nr:2-dehydropantoate 2-reductase [Candidatus Diapherotrites archaeon]